MPPESPHVDPAHFRPKRYPAPDFPPRRAALFARTPPAIFPVLLGLLGLALALRVGLVRLGLTAAPGDLVAGVVLPLWAFGLVAYAVKLARRPGVIFEDMRVMPARGGLAMATASGMLAAALLAPHARGLAAGLLWSALVLHALYALLFLRFYIDLPPEGRAPDPGWHLIFAGFILGAPAALLMGLPALAQGLLIGTIPIAMILWIVALIQLFRGNPPAPLRPLLALHLVPASLFTSVAVLAGYDPYRHVFAVLAVVIFLALLAAGRWLLVAGFSPLWGVMTLPLSAFAAAMIQLGGPWAGFGIGLLAVALVVIPWIAWRVLSMWARGSLATKTNAAEA
ncbi:MAG: tellurium resistance protein [Rhodobacteraceae bacterium]|jgi:tellurite resistance protein|nr:tellurium resistance protein [Paracoccaceae bacterium]